jgi:hypothetical protein
MHIQFADLPVFDQDRAKEFTIGEFRDGEGIVLVS